MLLLREFAFLDEALKEPACWTARRGGTEIFIVGTEGQSTDFSASDKRKNRGVAGAFAFFLLNS